MNPDYRYLAHFLGPKAENEEFLERLAGRVIRDYCYWRRNYFPQDPLLLSSSRRRELEDEYDNIERQIDAMMADLRRTFPFYSPRYIAHQQSEVSTTSLLGFLAGLLYNPNNVTSESGAVTVDYEIEACSWILEMLGLLPPPPPPTTSEQIDSYHKSLQRQFGWAHISSGGTAANIEALWVARSVRYSVLGLLEAAKALRLDVPVKIGVDRTKSFRALQPIAALGLKVNEIIYLHGRLVECLARSKGLNPEQAQTVLNEAVASSKCSIGRGYGHVFGKFPPALLVSGAAHYSFKKAADVLGIGRDNVEVLDMDECFRLDPRALRLALERLDRQGRIPVAVVGIVGTTEEGSIDPIHTILDIRREREEKLERSFWLHIDAAWGGFLRSLFRFRDKRPVFTKRLDCLREFLAPDLSVEQVDSRTLFRTALETRAGGHTADRFDELQALGKYSEALNLIATVPNVLLEGTEPGTAQLKTVDTVNAVGDYVSATVQVGLGARVRELSLRWSHWDVGAPILAMEEADSITIDPHKMGYTPYPIGVVAFANDRVRRFIAEDAPYITTQGRTALTHRPPKHMKEKLDEFGRPSSVTMAFAPYTLEGSRAGAAACAIWLAFRALPLDQANHGAVLRSSLLAARALHEWLKHWGQTVAEAEIDQDFEFVPLVEHAPDSNIVIFVVKKKSSASIEDCKDLTARVYSQFSIRAELGEREYSYSQPFFLSSTPMKPPAYSHRTMTKFLDRAGLRHSGGEYAAQGLLVLRATVQNPYLTPLLTEDRIDLVKEFVMELSTAAGRAVKAVDSQSGVGGS